MRALRAWVGGQQAWSHQRAGPGGQQQELVSCMQHVLGDLPYGTVSRDGMAGVCCSWLVNQVQVG
jgi:hypothetical protein